MLVKERNIVEKCTSVQKKNDKNKTYKYINRRFETES